MYLKGCIWFRPSGTPLRGWIELDGPMIGDCGIGAPPAPAAFDAGDAIIMPAFIDAHTHLPQFDAIGCDRGALLPWLDKAIYPAEESWQNESHATGRARAALSRLKENGTLAAAVWLTSHAHGARTVVEANASFNLRLRAGVVAMDRGAPQALLQRAESYELPTSTGEVEFSVNPRFAPACTREMLERCASLSRHRRAWIQTHLAEQREECELVRSLFPEAAHYTDVYDRVGLIGPRTLLAHCLHLSREEWMVLVQRCAVAVHCPVANAFLGSGLFDLRLARARGGRVALGSDVGAGSAIAMPDVARAMIDQAKIRRAVVDPSAWVPTPADAIDMITRGNADALNWPDLGRIERGCTANLLVVEAPFDRDGDFAGRLLYEWGRCRITQWIVAGRVTER